MHAQRRTRKQSMQGVSYVTCSQQTCQKCCNNDNQSHLVTDDAGVCCSIYACNVPQGLLNACALRHKRPPLLRENLSCRRTYVCMYMCMW